MQLFLEIIKDKITIQCLKCQTISDILLDEMTLINDTSITFTCKTCHTQYFNYPEQTAIYPEMNNETKQHRKMVKELGKLKHKLKKVVI